MAEPAKFRPPSYNHIEKDFTAEKGNTKVTVNVGGRIDTRTPSVGVAVEHKIYDSKDTKISVGAGAQTDHFGRPPQFSAGIGFEKRF